MKKSLNRIVLGLKLVEHKSEKPKFLGDPNSYLSIQGGGEVGGIQKTQTETIEDPNWNNMSCFLHFDQLSSLGLLGWSPEVERNFLNMNISFFDDLGGLLSHFGCLSLLGLLGRSPEVECNPKTSISFFDDLGGLFYILVNFCCLDHLANHQKLNIIYKNEYFIFWWLRGPFVTFQLTFIAWIARSITRSWA